MVDPDAPSRWNPTNAEWLHWLVVNIPNGQVEKGNEWVRYQGPAPPPKTGPHRVSLSYLLCFLVFSLRYSTARFIPVVRLSTL